MIRDLQGFFCFFLLQKLFPAVLQQDVTQIHPTVNPVHFECVYIKACFYIDVAPDEL